MYRKIILFISLLLIVAVNSAESASVPSDVSQTNIGRMPLQQITPLVVIYTLSTCPHCKEAKDCFTRNNIPFVNREVDTDSQHMDDLMKIYDAMAVPEEKRGVPLILIGDKVKLQGFNRIKVQEALKRVLH